MKQRFFHCQFAVLHASWSFRMEPQIYVLFVTMVRNVEILS